MGLLWQSCEALLCACCLTCDSTSCTYAATHHRAYMPALTSATVQLLQLSLTVVACPCLRRSVRSATVCEPVLGGWQVLYAEREFMAAQLRSSKAHNSALVRDIQHLQQQLLVAGITPGTAEQTCATQTAKQAGSPRWSSDSFLNTVPDDIFADANR